MRDGQYRLLWTGISDSKKMKAVQGDRLFRIGCHLVYTWLLPWCDDDGRMPGEPLKILANVAPNEDFSLKEIERMLSELDRVALIRWYEVDGEWFIQILDWEKYQRIRKDRYNPSRYPQWQPNDNQMATNLQQNRDPISSPSLSPSPSLSLSDLQHREVSFEDFWNAYPSRNGKKLLKQEAKEFYLKNIQDEEAVLLLQATKNYAASKTAMDGYAKDPVRFLKKNFWKDWIEPEEKTSKTLSGLKAWAREIKEEEDANGQKAIPGTPCVDVGSVQGGNGEGPGEDLL
jgi:hypothetical protein